MPKRIQRKRTRGWRMPEGAVYVGRPTKWGNPWNMTAETNRDFVVALFKAWMLGEYASTAIIQPVPSVTELRGKDLACWCPIDQQCHADVLLELANA